MASKSNLSIGPLGRLTFSTTIYRWSSVRALNIHLSIWYDHDVPADEVLARFFYEIITLSCKGPYNLGFLGFDIYLSITLEVVEVHGNSKTVSTEI